MPPSVHPRVRVSPVPSNSRTSLPLLVQFPTDYGTQQGAHFANLTLRWHTTPSQRRRDRMASITFLDPTAQYSGSNRLLSVLRTALARADFVDFRLAVAFAKSQPLAKLSRELQAWRRAGKATRAIIGLSHKGTSAQALELALGLFDETYVCYPGSISTFHPKFYIFAGPDSACSIFGSHNLTAGGTETNYEAGIRIDFALPADTATFREASACWDTLLPVACPSSRLLDDKLLSELVTADLLFDESIPRQRFKDPDAAQSTSKTGRPRLFPLRYPKPPESLPLSALPASTTRRPKIPSSSPPMAVTRRLQVAASLGQELVLQIVPHHNGEVFLSKLAINQNPRFFGFPFSGQTTPKKASNASYPQREPDPIVDVTVYDNRGAPVLQKLNYGLNTVFYKPKSEIRITLSPDIVDKVEPFSVLHMRLSNSQSDYLMDIYNPGSPRYTSLMATCNQILPSGGAARARKMGWL
jgi:HKD family nuclease